VQPFDYVLAADRSGYLPLAARSEKLYALIVTAENSPIRTVADLKGKRISLPPRDAAISRLIRVYLRKHGLVAGKNVEYVYLRSHTSCLQHVLSGLIDACGTTPSAMHHLKNPSRETLRGITETDAIPPALFVVHSRVPEAERKLLLNAILAWPKAPDGLDIQLTGFTPISDSAYDVVRKFPAD
jgi:ABC-type phosphate/phosphonate transport system substrate-binding protein